MLLAQSGDEFGSKQEPRRWWDYAILLAATGVFVWLGIQAVVPPLAMNPHWVVALSAVLLVALLGGGWTLWRHTRFS